MQKIIETLDQDYMLSLESQLRENIKNGCSTEHIQKRLAAIYPIVNERIQPLINPEKFLPKL